MNDRERRYRFFRISPDQIMTLLGEWWHVDAIRLPRIANLPDGYRVVAIQYSHGFAEDCFCLKVYHPSFEPLPVDGRVPTMEAASFEFVDLREVRKAHKAKEQPTTQPVCSEISVPKKGWEFLGAP